MTSLRLLAPVLLGGALLGFAGQDAPRPASVTPNEPSGAREAIETLRRTFADAYGKADSTAVAALFTEDGRVYGPEGNAVTGRDAIQKAFAAYFEASPGRTLEVTPESLKFLGSEVAIQEGRTRIIMAEAGAPTTGRFRALFVKQGDKWLQHELHDFPDVPPVEIVVQEPLAQLEWILGEWVDESPNSIVNTSCRYVLGKRFILREYESKLGGQPYLSGFQLIGFDAQSGQIKSWVFDSEGGYGEGLWARNGDQWIIKTTGILGDGTSATSTQVVTRMNKDAVKWTSVDRTVGSETAPSIDEILLVRKPPTPGGNAPADPPKDDK